MFKQEQERITRELDNARGRLAAISLEYQTIEDNLNHALRLARDSHAAYKLATPKMRRLFNQAFFEKIYISDDGEVTHRFAEPFRTLLDPALPAQLRGGSSEVDSEKPRSRVDLRWQSEDEGEVGTAASSNFDVVVRPAGFEPATLGLEVGSRRYFRLRSSPPNPITSLHTRRFSYPLSHS